MHSEKDYVDLLVEKYPSLQSLYNLNLEVRAIIKRGFRTQMKADQVADECIRHLASSARTVGIH